MTMRPQRLELTWIGKDERPKLEPRILLEDPDLSHHAPHRVSEDDIFDNRLIFGDNLLALKALEQEFAGKVKCVYIDPPFNTGEMFEHYPDGLEHTLWLSQMRDRLQILRALLTRDGTIFVHIDDSNLGYLLVLMDEVFGNENRRYVVTFRQGAVTGHKAINPGMVSTSNFVLVYSRQKADWRPNRVYAALEKRDDRYGTFIENVRDPYKSWRFRTLSSAFAAYLGEPEKGLKKRLGDEYEPRITEFVIEHADSVVQLARPDYSAVGEAVRKAIDKSKANPSEIVHEKRDSASDMFLIGGRRILFYRNKLRIIDGELISGTPLSTIWDDLLSNNLHAEGGVSFPKGKKPEALIKRCLEIATNPGDIVLDSFAGSGTTAAVAHKMGRRWITVELGEQAHTHIIPRMQRVINGEDHSGVTKAVDWKGGGGFRYFRLAPSLLKEDPWGRLVINRDFNPEMLAEAVCKLEGFSYAPSDTDYWSHGHSTERDFIYVTTAHLDHNGLQHLSDVVGPDRTLLVCCGSFKARHGGYDNLTVKKIPNAVLDKAEWGRDDYSLAIQELPDAPPAAAEHPDGQATAHDGQQALPMEVQS